MHVTEAQETTGRKLRRLAALAVLAALLAGTLPASAEDAAELEARHRQTLSEYERIVAETTLTEQRIAELAAEIAAVRKDRASLSTALIQAAKTERKLAEDAAAIEERLAGLREQEDGIRASLRMRRGVLAEVLAALQRMGLNPPPAILVRPEDALSSVRSAIVLGAVVPELRAETEILAGDLAELAALRASIAGERDRLVATAAARAAERERLSMLLSERERLLASSETEQAAARERAAELAGRALDLRELIASLEAGIADARAAVEAARRAEEERERREAELAGRPVPERFRLGESLPFEGLAGRLALPAAGHLVRRFGEPDGLGGHLHGDTLQTQSGSIVTALADGTVLYAGAFRSYGQLLILDAGGGYHVVLAGMARISVSLGQSVLAGEPVGAMGEARIASADAVGGSAGPELYVEFRKDGRPVDPSRWWTERSSGRTGNDT